MTAQTEEKGPKNNFKKLIYIHTYIHIHTQREIL